MHTGDRIARAVLAVLAAGFTCAITSPALAGGVDDPGLPTAAEAFATHVRAGDEHYALQQYLAAFEEYKTAYGIKQPPELLYNLGRTARKLGRAEDALFFLERYLLNEPVPPTARGVDVARQVKDIRMMLAEAARAEAAARLPPGVRMVPARIERRRNAGLMAAGGVTLALNYTA